ncbi:IST1-like protein [Actinidia chinensis var. chinensis]|uniref:IST1-like protein n=1 Tax=Actinidia chinensis var. chinensis TaxID=1590841 RepID=A0A2R6Q0S4_ACTCC|nr:IST1-like protein [Actinidia chinensis var. chinensis]
MSMLDSFFNKGFKAPKCKTLLKLTIPRIKLLRNRREIQIKQMRRDIAKLLETGQEATARIRVEHIIREEKMMAAQEIIELFCELITVRLPIIEVQRECPLDLKEAISSVCFAAPRCTDLPELLQAQMLFVAKYGKEFVSAATELMPECGVNRQLIELLSIRAPDPDVKLNLLKEIAEEHQLDWDPAASEIELLKPHEDLLNGPTQFNSGAKLPLPKEKHDESLHSASEQGSKEHDAGFDTLDFPQVPKASVRQSVGTVSAPEMFPFPEVDIESVKSSDANEHLFYESNMEPDNVLQEKSVANNTASPKVPFVPTEEKQFVPFISPPSPPPVVSPVRKSESPLPLSRTKSEVNVDLQDVLAAAHAAAESAERAAAAARSAATLAQVRISELVKKKSDEITDGSTENPFHTDTCQPATVDNPHLSHQNSSSDTGDVPNSPNPLQNHENHSVQRVLSLPSDDNHLKAEFDSSPFSSNNVLVQQASSLPSYDNHPKVEFDSSPFSSNDGPGHDTAHHEPQWTVDESFFSYPSLFTRQDSNIGSGVHASTDNSRSTHDL